MKITHRVNVVKNTPKHLPEFVDSLQEYIWFKEKERFDGILRKNLYRYRVNRHIQFIKA